MTAYADDWLAINTTHLSEGPPISTINDALASCGQHSVSLHIISIPEILPSAKVYLHCHNNTIVQMGCMKYGMKWERDGIQSDMLGFREEGIACLALFTVPRQNKS